MGGESGWLLGIGGVVERKDEGGGKDLVYADRSKSPPVTKFANSFEAEEEVVSPRSCGRGREDNFTLDHRASNEVLMGTTIPRNILSQMFIEIGFCCGASCGIVLSRLQAFALPRIP